MPPFHEDDRVTVHHGDCLDVLRTLPDCSVDSVVTDPPAAISFMSKSWDDDKGGRDAWVAWLASVLAECRRILKPGGHAVVWALPRTSGWTHRAIEDAGLDVRDCITHLFGSGFPKSHDVSKSIDREAGAERTVLGYADAPDIRGHDKYGNGETHPRLLSPRTVPATEDAARWDGWGTALKPSSEMWYLARRPLTSTVAANVTAWGTGALNISATRVGTGDRVQASAGKGAPFGAGAYELGEGRRYSEATGRWPSNVVLTHSPSDPEDGCDPSCPVAELDAQSGILASGGANRSRAARDGSGIYGATERSPAAPYVTDSGSASRFFPTFRYQAKAPTRERPKVDGVAHPTCKPRDLMRFLVRLITPPGGVVLDPFAGSGTTAEAAILEGFRCITIEREAEYLPLILERIRRQQPTLAEARPVAEQMSLLDDGSAA